MNQNVSAILGSKSWAFVASSSLMARLGTKGGA